MPERLVIGTRGSALALWQARHVQALLTAALGVEVVLEIIKTSGDKNTEQPLSQIGAAAGGKGLFVKEIEEALLAKQVHLAVHSAKDLPSTLAGGLAIAAFMEREDPRDALLSRVAGTTLASLPPGSKVGTSSLRRAAQLLARRADLEVLDLRGNVDTRVRKLDEGKYDAILLAFAGLKRMGLAARATCVLEIEEMLPAVGQGALAIETRASDPLGAEIAAVLDHRATRVSVVAERAFLARLEGGCTLPVAAHARFDGTRVALEALIARPPSSGKGAGAPLRATGSAAADGAAALGKSLAEELLHRGGREILEGLAR